MKKVLIVTQIALLTSIIAKIVTSEVDKLDVISAILLSVSTVLNIREAVQDAK